MSGYSKYDLEEDLEEIEDNIEDSGVVERSEWVGQKQKPVNEYPEVVTVDNINKIEEVADNKDEQEINEVLESLRAGLPTIPGLELDTLINKFIDNNPIMNKMFNSYNDIIENKDGLYSKEDIDIAIENMKIQRNNMFNQYKGQFQESIDIIQSCFREMKDGVIVIKDTISGAASSMTIPDVIVTGSATGAPNLAKEVIKIKQLKATLSVQINQLKTTSIQLLHESLKIGFVIPESILGSIKDISNLSLLLEKLPC